MSNQKCEYCDKRGVPIFPVRYAIALPGVGAPQIANKPSIELSATSAQYTLRLLRSGYLYVFDEARKRWDEYFITPDGYFFKISTQVKGIAPALPTKPFNCPDEGHRAIASCITIPDAQRATKVWLGFSDVQWTETVRKRNESEDYRKRHMRCVDVKAYTAGVDAKHCQPIKELASKVVEYTLDKTGMQRTVGFSRFKQESRKGRAERLIQEAEKLAPGKGFMLTLNDPVGIAAELADAMVHHASTFANDKKRKHPLMASMAIAEIKNAVEMQAVEAEHQAAEKLANEYISQPDITVLFSDAAKERRVKTYESIRDVSADEARRARIREWAKYQGKFNEPAMLEWQKQFEAESKKFHADVIQPLAKSWIAWADGKPIKDRFQCHYDDNDLESGKVYTATVSMVVNGAQDKKDCLDYLAQKMLGNFEPENYLLNAMVLGQKSLKEQVNKAVAAASIDPRIFPSDAYIGFQGGVAEKLAKGEASQLNQYLLLVNAPLIKLFGQFEQKIARPLWAAMAMHSGKQFVTVTVTGSKKAFRTRVIKELLRHSGQTLNPHEMQRAISAQLRNLKVAGVPLEGSEKKTFTLLLDPKQVKNLPAGQGANWLAANLRTVEQLDNVVMGEWKAALGKASASIPYISGLLAGIWQWYALDKLAEDESKAMSHEAQEATWKLRAGTSAFIGTVLDVAGKGMEKIAVTFKLGRGLEVLGSLISWAGRLSGLFAAAVVAFWDANNAYASYRKGEWGMFALYSSSAILGITIGLMAMFGVIPFIGWLAIIALIGITLVIELFKDNKLQSWLGSGFWGGRQYKTPDEEMKELKLAIE